MRFLGLMTCFLSTILPVAVKAVSNLMIKKQAIYKKLKKAFFNASANRAERVAYGGETCS
jgi:hypothetical protein